MINAETTARVCSENRFVSLLARAISSSKLLDIGYTANVNSLPSLGFRATSAAYEAVQRYMGASFWYCRSGGYPTPSCLISGGCTYSHTP